MSGETPDPYYYLSIAQRLWFLGKERPGSAPLHRNAEVPLGPPQPAMPTRTLELPFRIRTLIMPRRSA